MHEHIVPSPSSWRAAAALCYALCTCWALGCAEQGLAPNWGAALFSSSPIEKDLSQDDEFVSRVKKDSFPNAPRTSSSKRENDK